MLETRSIGSRQFQDLLNQWPSFFLLMAQFLSICPLPHLRLVGISPQFVSSRKQDGLCGLRCYVLA